MTNDFCARKCDVLVGHNLPIFEKFYDFAHNFGRKRIGNFYLSHSALPKRAVDRGRSCASESHREEIIIDPFLERLRMIASNTRAHTKMDKNGSNFTYKEEEYNSEWQTRKTKRKRQHNF